MGDVADCDIPTEQIQLSKTGLAHYMQPREANMKLSETMNDTFEKHDEIGSSSTHTDSLQTKA